MTDATCWAFPATERLDMARTLLLRGMLAGVLAGVMAGAFAMLFGEPQLELAIGFGSLMDHAADRAPQAEMVGRTMQRSAGLLVAGVSCGAALGGIVALVFAFAYQRVGRVGPKALAAMLAGGGFIAAVLVPQLKYPANPPSIGHAETIGLRTALHFEMILIALAALTLAILLGRHLLARLGGLERLARRSACIHLHRGFGPARAARYQRGAGGLPSRRPVAVQDCLYRHAAGALGVARCDLRRVGRPCILPSPWNGSNLTGQATASA